METTGDDKGLYRDYTKVIGYILGLYRIMEKKMETTIV